MMRRRATSIWIERVALGLWCCCFAAVAVAAHINESWAAIPSEELAMKDDPFNPGAKAIILYRDVFADDSKGVESQHYRIKILTDEGRAYADVQIAYANRVNSIENIRARVVQPDGRIVEFNGEVYDKLVIKSKKLRVQVKTFTLPEVRQGSIIEYSYLERWHGELPDPYIHPEGYIVEGTDTVPTTHWVIPRELFIRKSRFTLRPVPRANIAWSGIGISKQNEPVRQPDGSYVMQVDNVPAFVEEESMPPEEALKARVDFFYYVGKLIDARDFWSTYIQRYADSIERVCRQSKAIHHLVADTISVNDPAETTLRKLYERAQQFEYAELLRRASNEGEPVKRSINLSELVRRGYGSGNEINLLFVVMARAVGFTAAPVLVANREKRFFRPNLMDASQLDAMIAWVQIGSKEYYLDPAMLYCPFDLLPWNETVTLGYRIEKPYGVFVTTPDVKSADAVIERKGSLQLDRYGNLQGRIRVVFSGQEALQRRAAGSDSDASARRKTLVDELRRSLPSGSTVNLIDLNKWEQSDEPLRAEFSIKVPNYASSTGRRLLVPLEVFQGSQKAMFQSVKRTHPVYFPYAYEEVDEIELQLPNGKEIESLPGPRSQTAGFGMYEISCRGDRNVLRVKRRVTMNGIGFRADDYAQLRKYYSGIRSGDEQQLVLQNTMAAESTHVK